MKTMKSLRVHPLKSFWSMAKLEQICQATSDEIVDAARALGIEEYDESRDGIDYLNLVSGALVVEFLNRKRGIPLEPEVAANLAIAQENFVRAREAKAN